MPRTANTQPGSLGSSRPAKTWLSSGGRFVELTNRGSVRCRPHYFWVVFDVASDLAHRIDKSVERFLAFGFRWLDHQCLGNYQGEIDRRWMVAEVHQPLGNIHRFDSVLALLPLGAENALVHTDFRKSDIKEVLELHTDIVGIEHCVLCDLCQPLPAIVENIGVGAQDAEKRTVLSMDTSNSFGQIVIQPEPFGSRDDLWHRQIRIQNLFDADRPRAR
jgi:hypothetical protein